MRALKSKHRFDGATCVHVFDDGIMIAVDKSTEYDDVNQLSPEPYSVRVGIYDPVSVTWLTHEFSAFETISAAENWIEKTVSKLKDTWLPNNKKPSQLRIIK